MDESGNPVLSTDIKVESDATYFHTSLIQDKVPSGWELKDVGDIAIAEDNTATVVLREKAHTKDVTVNYVTEDGENVGTESVTVEKEYDYIETSWLKEVPEYYEIVEPGKVTIGEDNTAEVVVRKTMKNVIVNFVDESGNPVLSTDIKVESDATYFHTSLIQDKIPSGWELKEVGDVAIAEDNTATVVLRASKKPEEPNKPEEPDKPEKPNKPSDSDRPSESEKPSDSHKVPMTGDQSPVGMAALGLLASMGLLISRKRK